MNNLECTIIDETIYSIIKDEYQERKFGLREINEVDPKTKIYHMLYKDDLITDTNQQEVSLLPVNLIFAEGIENEPDKVYCIIQENGDTK
ncbi:hypothetical protein [Macrococcus equi]|uniref:hypothetical protein n=1 Tax=Macrococcus equi TaxID=3395462 RepID=UPI0039BE2E54